MATRQDVVLLAEMIVELSERVDALLETVRLVGEGIAMLAVRLPPIEARIQRLERSQPS